MPRAANPENVRMIAEVERLRLEGVSIPKACARVGLKLYTYHSWRAKQREREEDAKAWGYVGKAQSRIELK